MILNLIVIGAVLLIAYLWASRGFFSAFLHLLCTIAGLPPLPEGVVALPGPRR